MPKQFRGFLKCCDGIFQLGEKFTRIENSKKCDLILDRVECSHPRDDHAVIEYDPDECRFYLQNVCPLTSGPADATYVNDCEVVASAVPLHCGDLVRFGCNGRLFQFEVVETDLNSTMINCDGKEETIVCCDGLPQLRSVITAVANEPNNDMCKALDELRSNNKADKPKWITGPKLNETRQAKIMKLLENPKVNQELKNLVCEEIGRLNIVECDSLLHCDVINQLREEVTYLQNRLRCLDTGCCCPDGCSKCQPKFLQLERCCPIKTEPTSGGMTQMGDGESGGDMGVTSHSRKLITLQSLVTDMKRDMMCKDKTICVLTKDLEERKKELFDCQCKARALTQTVRYMCACRDYTSDFSEKFQELVDEQKELIELRRKSEFQELNEKENSRRIQLLDRECEQLNGLCQEQAKDLLEKQMELCVMKTRIDDLERSDGVIRVDLEQLRSRFEKVRSLVIQLGHSDKNMSHSDKHHKSEEHGEEKGEETKLLSDDEVLAAACQQIKIKSELNQRIRKLEEELKRLGKKDKTEVELEVKDYEEVEEEEVE